MQSRVQYWASGMLMVLASSVFAAIEQWDAPRSAEESARDRSVLTEQLKHKPNDTALLLQRAHVLFRLGDFEKSIADYNRVLALSDNDEAYFGRGMAQGRAGRLEMGIADLSIYLSRHPQSSFAYTKRGVRYLWLGDLDKAYADLSRAVELNPNNAEAHDDLGVIYAKRGNLVQAARHFNETLRIEPSYQKAHHNMALVHVMAGKFKEALPHVDEAIRLQPRIRSSLILKSVILEALGRKEEAQWLKNEAARADSDDWSETSPVR